MPAFPSLLLYGACTYIGNGPNFMVKSRRAGQCKDAKLLRLYDQVLDPDPVPLFTLVWYLFYY